MPGSDKCSRDLFSSYKGGIFSQDKPNYLLNTQNLTRVLPKPHNTAEFQVCLLQWEEFMWSLNAYSCPSTHINK